MRRWITFNLVGVVGFGVQLLVLASLLGVGVDYLAATVLAVETAVLQNFVWHERWTWRDRKPRRAGRVARLWRFHLLNGLVSVVGNLALMRLLVGELRVAPIPANLVAALVCSMINFALGDRLVWEIAGSEVSKTVSMPNAEC
jgi:dolichol-phosphate mannosyltransferase